jgi:hypothetical protein
MDFHEWKWVGEAQPDALSGFICDSPQRSYHSFLANKNQMEVGSAWGKFGTPIQPITGWPSLFPSSFTYTALYAFRNAPTAVTAEQYRLTVLRKNNRVG